jgi:hypothetical protein
MQSVDINYKYKSGQEKKLKSLCIQPVQISVYNKKPFCVGCKTTEGLLLRRGFYKINKNGEETPVQRYACRDCNTRYGKKYRDTNKKAWKYCYISHRKTVSKYPEKTKARARLNYAIIKGRIIKPLECSVCCEKNKVEAHHKDYSKPFEVIWLCRQCHANLEHKIYG